MPSMDLHFLLKPGIPGCLHHQALTGQQWRMLRRDGDVNVCCVGFLNDRESAQSGYTAANRIAIAPCCPYMSMGVPNQVVAPALDTFFWFRLTP